MKAPLITLAIVLTLPGGVVADEMSPDGRPHFSGKEADSVEEAFHHFEEGNERLSKYLEGDTIEAADLAHIHELTYTLENALGKMQAALSSLAVTLEEVHLASEKGDQETVLKSGREYLWMADRFDD
ncbi:DUF6746 family protein [Halochromatium sp.]